MTKNIMTLEKVDAPRDQTTHCISLLEDFRSYIMSCQHTGISSNYMMMSGPEGTIGREDPSNTAHSWIQDFRLRGTRATPLKSHMYVISSVNVRNFVRCFPKKESSPLARGLNPVDSEVCSLIDTILETTEIIMWLIHARTDTLLRINHINF